MADSSDDAFSSARLRFRNLATEDALAPDSGYVLWMNDPDVVKHLGVSSVASATRKLVTPEDCVAYIRQNLCEGHKLFVMELGGRHMGNFRVFDIDTRAPRPRASLSLMIGEKALWRQGLGSEAIRAVILRFHQSLGILDWYLAAHADNPACALYSQLGFARISSFGGRILFFHLAVDSDSCLQCGDMASSSPAVC